MSTSFMGSDLYASPEHDLTEPVVRSLIQRAIDMRLQAESLMLEFKSRNTNKGVVEAVAAMANTDGGVVVVGVDENSDPDHFCGITSSELDGLVQQLRALLPGVMPEVIPVRLTDKVGRLLALIRVDADGVDRPVVVDGRVMKRVPGLSVGARRDEIVTLVNTPTANGAMAGAYLPMDPGNVSTWADSPSRFELRAVARLHLPRSAELRRYLGTAAMTSATEALNSGPAPRLTCSNHLRPRELGGEAWHLETSGSLRAEFRCDARPNSVRGVQKFAGCGRLQLRGRVLEILVAIKPAEPSNRLALEDLFDMLLSTSVTASQAASATAASIGFEFGLESPGLEAWIKGPLDLYAGGMSGAVRDDASDYRFMPLRALEPGVDGLVILVREWLTPFLFDLGAIDVETRLAALDPPSWVRTLVDADGE